MSGRNSAALEAFLGQSVIYGLTRAFGEIASRILGVQTQSRLEEARQNRAMQLNLERLELDRARLNWEKARWIEDIAEQRRRLFEASCLRLNEISHELELKSMLEQHPVRLLPSVFQRNYPPNKIPLHVIVAPTRASHDNAYNTRIQVDLEDKLLEFGDRFYTRNDASHPVRIFTECWRAGFPCGSSAVAGLFQLFRGVPFVIIESVAVTDGFSFRVGYWSAEQETESYARIGMVPWQAIGQNGDSGVSLNDLALWYQLVVALVADQLHMLQSGAAPKLPGILRQMVGTGALPDWITAVTQGRDPLKTKGTQPIAAAIISAYREIFGAYAVANGPLAPEILLDLSEALLAASFTTEAHDVAEDSIDAFVALRRGPAAGSGKIDIVEVLYRPEDGIWLLRLADLMRKFGKKSIAERLIKIYGQ